MKHLSFLILLAMVGCSTENSPKIAEPEVHVKTSNRLIQSNFNACLHTTQQLIKRRFTEKELSAYFSVSPRATGFEFENAVLHLSDTIRQLPQGYQIFYDFVYKGDTIGCFRADFDANVRLTYFQYFHLLAYRKFVDRELTISSDKARQIAVANGMKTEKMNLVFRCSKDYPDTTNIGAAAYYWECNSYCDGCLCLHIDAQTGEIIDKAVSVIEY